MPANETWKLDFKAEDVFEIPILEFNLESDVTDLVGQRILSSLYDTLEISKAIQRTALIFDEEGAEVESVAVISSKSIALIPNEPKPKQLLFDKPYLIVFKKKSETNPYLMIWIDNSELMKKK